MSDLTAFILVRLRLLDNESTNPRLTPRLLRRQVVALFLQLSLGLETLFVGVFDHHEPCLHDNLQENRFQEATSEATSPLPAPIPALVPGGITSHSSSESSWSPLPWATPVSLTGGKKGGPEAFFWALVYQVHSQVLSWHAFHCVVEDRGLWAAHCVSLICIYIVFGKFYRVSISGNSRPRLQLQGSMELINFVAVHDFLYPFRCRLGDRSSARWLCSGMAWGISSTASLSLSSYVGFLSSPRQEQLWKPNNLA